MSFIIKKGILEKYYSINKETDITVPEGVTEIGNMAFYGRVSLVCYPSQRERDGGLSWQSYGIIFT